MNDVVDGGLLGQIRAVEAEEAAGVEQAFELVHRVVDHEAAALSGLQQGGFFEAEKVGNMGQRHHFQVLAHAHHKLLLVAGGGRRGRRLQLLNKLLKHGRVEQGRAGCRGGRPQLPQLAQSGGQLGLVDGLEQVINAVDLEGLQRILVVGGGEDDRAGHAGLLKQLKAEAVGEVNVEEEHVGRGAGAGKQGRGLRHRLGRAHYRHGRRLPGQQLGEAAGGQGLVFDDDCAHIFRELGVIDNK